jgi:autoinducer 2-degrading protein
MEVILVHVQVKPEHVAAFIAMSKANHEGSRREPGNLRFDILQSAEDPTRFVFIEAFQSAEDAAAHKSTAHYLAWRDAVASWMAAPREGRRHVVLAPDDPTQW